MAACKRIHLYCPLETEISGVVQVVALCVGFPHLLPTLAAVSLFHGEVSFSVCPTFRTYMLTYVKVLLD